MPGPKEFYRIINKNGNSTSFHFIDSTLIPMSNFELALKWHNAKVLMRTSLMEMELLLSNSAFKKKYKKLVENSDSLYVAQPRRAAAGS